jgi:protein-disulfide isomerase
MNHLQLLLSSRTLRFLFALVLVGCGHEGGEASGASLQAVPEAEEGQPSGPEMGYDLSEFGHNDGDEDTALLGVVEFADFGCIHCADFHMQSFPALNTEFVGSGRILWKYIPITTGGFPNGNLAGAAGVCAMELESFPRMRDHIFRNREEWLVATTATATGMFVRYATEVGMDGVAFRACLESPEPHSMIEENNAVFRRLGLRDTPSFIVGGSLVRGAPPLGVFQTGLRNILTEIAEGGTQGDEAGP